MIERLPAQHTAEHTAGRGTVATASVPRRSPWRLAVLLVVLLAVIVLVRTVAVEPYRVRSDSMTPTIAQDSTVYVDKFTLRWDDVDRNDLVLFDRPDGENLKRVVGIAGDRVEMLDAVLHVNGEAVSEPYVDPLSLDGVFFGPVTVPKNTVFVLGDNRFGAVDSRDYGPVNVGDITGRLLGH